MTERQFWTTLGERVRAFRKHGDMTQGELAEEAGYTRTSIANLEAGRQKMPAYGLYRVARALGVRLWEILPDD